MFEGPEVIASKAYAADAAMAHVTLAPRLLVQHIQPCVLAGVVRTYRVKTWKYRNEEEMENSDRGRRYEEESLVCSRVW